MRISDWSSDVCSSDLEDETLADARAGWQSVDGERPDQLRSQRHEQKRQPDPDAQLRLRGAVLVGVSRGENVHDNCVLPRRRRSEEHTSELQSLMRLSYAVFCLKKKTIVTP